MGWRPGLFTSMDLSRVVLNGMLATLKNSVGGQSAEFEAQCSTGPEWGCFPRSSLVVRCGSVNVLDRFIEQHSNKTIDY